MKIFITIFLFFPQNVSVHVTDIPDLSSGEEYHCVYTQKLNHPDNSEERTVIELYDTEAQIRESNTRVICEMILDQEAIVLTGGE